MPITSPSGTPTRTAIAKPRTSRSTLGRTSDVKCANSQTFRNSERIVGSDGMYGLCELAVSSQMRPITAAVVPTSTASPNARPGVRVNIA